MVRIMQCMQVRNDGASVRLVSNTDGPNAPPQSVYRLYPKAFQVKYYGIQVLEHNFGRSSLFVVVAKLWFVSAAC